MFKKSGLHGGIPCFLVSLVLLLSPAANSAGKASLKGTVRIDTFRGPVAEFLPDEAFGAALDGQKEGELGRIYTADNLRKMQSARLRKITYRLRTELSIEAWHWSEQGTWSDDEHHQGYWTSSDSANQTILISHGYRLPRRGNTFDQGRNDGYSRLTDDDETTFWKSNPYLDHHYTGESDALHPQWVVIDLGRSRPIDAIRIDWGEPYARRFQVQYWVSPVDDFEKSEEGEWQNFPSGLFFSATSVSSPLRLVEDPVQARYVKILLLESSETALPGCSDIRDALGFAIREISLGIIDSAGQFQDAIIHAPSNKIQTVVYTSSTDPWHRAIDVDPNTEQPGFDLVFGSGLSNGLPVLVPVALLYDTPENAAAEIRFIQARGLSVRQVEMGEEPDGQYVSPEHEAALYLQFATALHKIDPKIALGGPSFQNGIVYTGFDVDQTKSWLERFLAYLRDHDRLEDYEFLSFEWYPFDDLCQRPSRQLLDQPQQLAEVFAAFRREGVSDSIPRIISEYGYSAFVGRTLVELPSALLNADIVGKFLSLGGKTAYLYGYEPSRPTNQVKRCAGYGKWMLFEADSTGRARWPMPIYFAARLLTEAWAQPVDKRHRVYVASSDVRDHRGRQIVTAYVLRRPDQRWSVLLVNKDAQHAYSVKIAFSPGRSLVPAFTGESEVFQYSRQQFVWKASELHGHPVETQSPRHFRVINSEVTLPPFSLTVVRGFGNHAWNRSRSAVRCWGGCRD
jgi:hypothetical protein